MTLGPDRPGPAILFPLVVCELALALLVVHLFDLEAQRHFFPVFCLAAGGFVVHAWLPARLRPAFFALLSLAGILLVLGWTNGGAVIGIGSGLIAVCYLPIPLALRVTLVGLAGFSLAMLRVEHALPFWPVLGSMFMFRLIVFLFDTRRGRTRPPVWHTLSYFFCLPNVCFPLFPVIDYTTYLKKYRTADPYPVYQTGMDWIARGLVHLLLYRVVKYYFLPAPSELRDLPHLALFLATNYALYLRVSGQFHVIAGILHLFGYGLPRTHHNYFFASSFTDIWRRINIYWKDFMAKVFFSPVLFACRGLGERAAFAVAALAVFLATWLLHAYQVFWLLGTLPLRLTDAALWLAAGAVVAVNLQFDLSRADRPASAARRATVAGATLLSLRVVGMFVLVSAFWACWNTPYVVGSLQAMPVAGPEARAGAATVLGVLLAAVVIGTAAQLVWGRLAWLLPPRLSPAASAFAVIPALAVLALLSTASVSQVFGPQAASVLASLRRESATPAEAAHAVQGYYEEATAARIQPGPFLAALEGKPVMAARVSYPELTRLIDPALERELIPAWRGEVEGTGKRLTINRFGMRDRNDLTIEKPPGACRLAVVGSSVVMGYGVGDAETFPRLLDDRLNAGRRPAEPRCEVLNFGAGLSYAIHRRILIDRKVFSFVPDAIYYVAHQDELDGPVKHLARMVSRGAEMPYPCLADVVRKAGVGPGLLRESVQAKLQPHARDIVAGIYRDLAAECRRRGVLLVWFYLPIPVATSTPVRATDFIDLAKETGLTVVDLSGWDAGHAPAAVKLDALDEHPNAFGQRLIEEQLGAALRDRPQLLPACARVR